MKVAAVLVIILATWIHLWAQSKRGQVGVQAPPIGFRTWPAGSHVKVCVVESGFQPGEVSFLLTPLASWNAAAHITRSRVKFGYAGTATSPRYCENCLTIQRRVLYDKRQRHNVANAMPDPTACDVAQVRLSCKLLTLSTSRMAVASKIVQGEVEEPVDHDTPIVIPKL